jgi:hypothetical protein
LMSAAASASQSRASGVADSDSDWMCHGTSDSYWSANGSSGSSDTRGGSGTF